MDNKGQNKDTKDRRIQETGGPNSDFVLDKVIFSNVFDKDIRRIYIYRKAERLAKAIQLITPAFSTAPSLRNRLDGIAVGLIDAAILPPLSARDALSRELLALSSLLSVARTGGLLSDMNADLIIREAHILLQEIASYQEPRLFLEEAPTLAELSKRAPDLHEPRAPQPRPERTEKPVVYKGHLSDNDSLTNRQGAILTILKANGPSYIKDISTMIRDVSEKTIQRELQSMVAAGSIERSGERRWTQYRLP